MTRVAVLADIHGNLPALEAVLAEVKKAKADLIVLNGDIADGPFPAETLDLLLTLGDKAVWLRGNGDRWLVEARQEKFRHPDPATAALTEWAAARITSAHRGKLAVLPMTHVIEQTGLGRIGFCHATCRSDNEMFLVDSSIKHCKAAFSQLDADILLLGHSHMPFDRLFDRRRLVNSGSVGMPYGHLGASWALIGSDIVLRRTLYDLDQASARILRTGMPGAEEFARANVQETPSDQDALEVFHAVLERQQKTSCFD